MKQNKKIILSTAIGFLIAAGIAWANTNFSFTDSTHDAIFGAKIQAGTNIQQGGASGPTWYSGSGSPNSAVTGSVGDFYLRTDGATGTVLYLKSSGAATNTGWTSVFDTGASTLTSTDLVVANGANALANYAGSSPTACGTGAAVTTSALSAAGSLTATCTTLVSGTNNTVTKFTGANTFGNSGITDDGTTVKTGEAVALTTANLTPAAPSAGVSLSSTQWGGREMLTAIGSVGASQPLQSSIGVRNWGGWFPMGGNTAGAGVVSSVGVQITQPVAGGASTPNTYTARSPATTNMCTALKRTGLLSATSSSSVAGQRTNEASFLVRGNASLVGGFFVVMRFMISDASWVSTGRTFVGVQNASGSPTDQDPAAMTNVFAVGNGSADTTLHMYMSGGAAQTATDLGSNFPANTVSTDCYELILFTEPNGGGIHWQVTRLNTGDVASGNQTTTANLPSNTTFLQPIMWRSNSTTATAVALDLIQMYFEMDH